MRTSVVVGVLAALAGCAKGEPTLELTLVPKFVTDDMPSRVRLRATSADGTIGKGSVKVDSALGSLSTPQTLQLDAYGTAQIDLVCDQRQEPACAQPVTVSAEWISDGVHVTAGAVLNPSATLGGIPGGGVGVGNGSGRILLLGTLAEGFCGYDALADPRAPTIASVAFDCYTDKTGAILAGGSLYFRVGYQNGLRRFREDSWDRAPTTGDSAYPSADKTKDDRLFESCGSVSSFWVSPGQRILHSCPQAGTGLFIGDQPLGYALSPSEVSAFGSQDAVLTYRGVVASDGTVHPFSTSLGLDGPSLPVPDGFLATSSSGGTCTLYKVAFDGTVTRQGGYPVRCAGKIDARGTMAYFSRDAQHAGADTVVEVPLDGQPTTIYSEANATNSDFSVYPPRVYVKIGLSALVSGN